MRDIDYNGHCPADEPEANPKQTDSTLLNPPADPALRAAWFDGYLAACSTVLASSQARINAILERERTAA